MPNLRDIKDRITSINNTQKITRAMKMVAAAKVKKAENKVKAARPFAKELAYVFSRLLRSVGGEYSSFNLNTKRAIDNYPALLKKREVKTVGILVVTSSKGLAGAYNANIIRFTLKKIEEYKSQNIKARLFIVGQKGVSGLRRQAKNYGFEIDKRYVNFSDPTSGSAIVVAEDMASSFVNGEIDSIEIITTSFKNMMSYKVQDWKILPLEFNAEEEKEENSNHIDALMSFEPNEHIVLQKVIPMFISNTIYHSFLEANASELASRMTAMSAACNNAQEMIRTLSIDYNKARQSAITQEINEVVSGADAL